MSFVRNRLFTVELEPIWQVATIFTSLVMSWLSWRIIERPFRVSLNHGGMTRTSIFALSGGSLVLLISLAGFVTMTGGMATARFSDAQLAALPPEQLRNPHRDRCFGARPPERFCTFGTQDADAPIEWFVWGDSHAGAMLPTFITLADRRGVRLSFAGQSACGPLPGLRRSDLRTRRNDTCSGHNSNVVEFLRRTPSITSVFLVGRWPIYTDGQYSPSADGVGDVILYAEDDLTLGNVEYGRNAILMENALERAVTGIAAPKRRVVLIGATPEIKWDVPRRRAAEILFGWPLPPAPTSDEVNERQAASSAILERVASKTGSFYIPLAQPMCAKGCTLFTESEMYYADDDHLSAVGAITLALPRLEAGLAGFIESGDEVWR